MPAVGGSDDRNRARPSYAAAKRSATKEALVSSSTAVRRDKASVGVSEPCTTASSRDQARWRVTSAWPTLSDCGNAAAAARRRHHRCFSRPSTVPAAVMSSLRLRGSSSGRSCIAAGIHGEGAVALVSHQRSCFRLIRTTRRVEYGYAALGFRLLTAAAARSNVSGIRDG